MGVVAFYNPLSAQSGQKPENAKLTTTDNLATITTAGYLNATSMGGQTISPSTFLDVLYSYNAVTNSGIYEVFTVSITNGVITLVQWIDSGNVLLPVVSGHFANFNGTSGQLHDAGFLPTNAADSFVVMSPGAVTIGDLPNFSDVNGTLADSGIASNKVLQAAFASPDINANMIVINSNNISGTSLNAGLTLFTPTGSKTYSVVSIVAGGAGNSNFTNATSTPNAIITAGGSSYGELTNTTMTTILSTRPYLLGGGTFVYASGANSTPSISNANPLSIAVDAGAFTSGGSLSIQTILLRTA